MNLLFMLTQSLVYLTKTAVALLIKADFCLLWHTWKEWFLWVVDDISVGMEMGSTSYIFYELRWEIMDPHAFLLCYYYFPNKLCCSHGTLNHVRLFSYPRQFSVDASKNRQTWDATAAEERSLKELSSKVIEEKGHCSKMKEEERGKKSIMILTVFPTRMRRWTMCSGGPSCSSTITVGFNHVKRVEFVNLAKKL